MPEVEKLYESLSKEQQSYALGILKALEFSANISWSPETLTKAEQQSPDKPR